MTADHEQTNVPAAAGDEPAPGNAFPVWLEVVLLLAILVVAAFLRLWQLTNIPAGLHFDEAIDLKIGLDVAGGARPIYVTEGWGREGLYYYLVALMLSFVPYNPLALRVSAVILSLGLLVTSYLLVRIWHGRLAAWLTVVLLAVVYWPLSAARFGVRHISLAFMLGLTLWVFWRLAQRPRQHWWHFALTGVLTSVTLYTYQPARFAPIIFVVFALYLALFHRTSALWNWRYWLTWLGPFVVVALPLVMALSGGGWALENDQRAFTVEPLTRLLEGDARPLLNNAVATLKVFTFSGDPLKSYNVPGRPVFVPAWTSVFFYAGLALAIWRWRRPAYAFSLIWLFFTMLPTVVTLSAPNFNRLVGAQTPIMFLAALAMAELVFWARDRRPPWALAAAVLLVVVTLAATSVATWRDYYHTWPNEYGDVHTLNREISAVANYLEHTPDNRAVAVSSRNIADEDPYIVDVSVDNQELNIRWVDTSQALVMPVGVDDLRLIITYDRWVDDDLRRLAALPDKPIYQERDFAVYELKRGDWTAGEELPLFYFPPGTAAAEPEPVDWQYPHGFCDCLPGQSGAADLLLTGVTPGENPRPGQDLELTTTWQTREEDSQVSLALFVHLIDDQEQIVAQYDGLGYPPHTWRSGDSFVQLARLPLPDSLPPGKYWLQFGLYERETGQRWQLLDPDQTAVADRILIGQLLVE